MKLLALRVQTRRSRILATALAAIAMVTATLLVTGQGYQTSQVRMHAGTAWLASSQIGHATLVDGATAEVAAKVEVAAPGTPLSVTQHRAAAYVLNRANGALRRIDGATERISPPVTLLSGAQDSLTITPAPHALYAVDTRSGMVASADLDTLAPKGTPQPLATQVAPDGLVLAGRSHLWTIAHKTGELIWLNGTRRHSRPTATQTGSLRLTVTVDQPVLVDPARGTAELLDPDTGAVTRSAQPDVQPGEAVSLSGSPDRSRLLLAIGARGTFTACAFDTSSCTAPLTIGSPGNDLGVPVEVANHAIVPNYSTGQATIIDLTTTRVVARRQLFDQPMRFELLTRDGFVFFNDPDSNRAGVLDLAGSVRTIIKYDPPHPGDGNMPTPDTRTRTDRPSQAHHDPADTRLTGPANRERKPGPGIPRHEAGPRTPHPPWPPSPTPTVSIVVKPSNHGLVGDQFELTLVSQPSTSIARVHWWFGDGNEDTGTTVHHRWQRPGTFTVRAAAVLTTGAQPPIAKTTVTVDPLGAPPRITQLNIRRPTPVIGEKAHFSAEVTRSPDKWAWTISKLGQPTAEITAHTPDFHHAFTTPGTYNVTLAITAGAHTAHNSRHLTVSLGAVRAWGNNFFGETSVPPEATSGVIAVAAGDLRSLALKADGTVIGWGSRSENGLPVPPEATSDVVAIAAGRAHNLALKTDGSVFSWGGNDDGKLTVPPQATSGVVAIAAGGFHSLALKAGSVIGWGNDFDGKLSVPPEATSGVVAIAAGNLHSLALKSDGSVIAWGLNFDDQASVPPATSGVVAIAAGGQHSLALKSDGSVIGWGSNRDGQTSVPPEATSGVVAIAAGGQHNLALKADGSVIGWGYGSDIGLGVPPEATSGVLAIEAGYLHSLAC